MADLSKIVSIIFEADDKLTAVMSGISKDFDSFGGKVTAIAQPLSDAADKVIALDAALATMAVAGLVASYNAAKDFESSAIDLEKVLNDEAGRMGEAKDAAIDLSNAYGTSASSVLLSAANFKQAGFTFDESIQLAKASLDLMIAGDIEAAQASELLVSALKGFGAPASEASRLIDLLNGVSNEYATDVEQLGIGMAKLSPVASTMGLSFEETAGILTPVIEVFRSGDEAATALKTGLLKLIDDSKPVKDGLAALGVSQTDLNGNLRSGKDILYDVMKAFEGLSEEEKLYRTQQIVGIDQAAKMVTVFDNYEKILGVTETALNSTGSAQAEVEKKLASGQAVLDKTYEAFKNLGILIGSEFLESTSGAVGGVGEIGQALQKIVDSGTFDDVFDAINEFAGELKTTLSNIAENLPEAFASVDFSKLWESLGDLGEEVKKFFDDDIDLDTVEGLADALQQTVNFLTGLVNVTTGMAQSMVPIFSTIVDGIQAIANADKDEQNVLGNLLGAGKLVIAMGVGVTAALATIAASGAEVTRVYDLVAGTIGTAWNLLQASFSAVVVGVVGSLDAILAAAEAVTFGDMNQSIKDARAELETFGEGVTTEFMGQMGDLHGSIGQIGDAFTGSGDKAADAKGQVDEFGNSVSGIPDTKAVDIQAGIDGQESVDEWITHLQEMDAITANVLINLDEDSATETEEKVKGYPVAWAADGTVIAYSTDLKEGTTDATKAKLDKEIPSEKLMEIKIKGEIDTEIARIKAGADTIQDAMEWQAKVDIAKAEADAERLKSAFENVGSVIGSTGDVISGLFANVPDATDPTWTAWKDALDQEMRIQRESWDQNKKLLEEQIKYMKIRNERLESGEPLINIETNGLEPELEMVMWKIIEKVQIRATEEASDFLLGI